MSMIPLVSARAAAFRYGTTVAVEPSTFDIPQGAVSALIGPNGSGKSTLLNAIAGLIAPSAGSVTLGAGEGSPPRISYVLQTTKVNEALPITVREVVTMGRYAGKGAHRRLDAADRARVEAAMERMGVASLAGRHLRALSGGERQRVFIAQGLAQDHDILLLDEPLTGLDLVSAQAIDAVIHEEQESGGTVVLSTHDLAEAGVADHVLLLAGRVVASGPPERVLTVANLTEAYGPSLLHVEGGQVFIDDPAHRPVEGRHLHRDRSIHVEAPGEDLHGGGNSGGQ